MAYDDQYWANIGRQMGYGGSSFLPDSEEDDQQAGDPYGSLSSLDRQFLEAGHVLGYPDRRQEMAAPQRTPDEALERTFTEFGGDMLNDVVGGVMSFSEGLTWLAGKALPFTDLEPVLDQFGQAKEIRSGWYSEKGRRARSKTYTGEDEFESFGQGVEKVTSDLLANLPSFLFSAGLGQALVRGVGKVATMGASKAIPGTKWLSTLQKSAAAGSQRAKRVLGTMEKVGGALGYGVGEGMIAAGMAGLEMEDQIDRVDHDGLYTSSARYRQIYDSYEGMDPQQRESRAREVLKDQAGNWAAMMTGISTAALSAPAGAILGRFTKGALDPIQTGSRLGATAIGAAAEGSQEVAQSTAEQILQNIGVQRYVDPSQPTFEGSLEAAVAGGITGGIMGGGFAMAGWQPEGAEIAKRAAGEKVTASQAKEFSEAWSAMVEAKVPAAEAKKILRWKRTTDVTVPEMIGALRQAAETGRAPENVEAVTGEDFGEDGYLSESAFIKDGWTTEEGALVARVNVPEGESQVDQLNRLFYDGDISPYVVNGQILVPAKNRKALVNGLDAIGVDYTILQKKEVDTIRQDSSGRVEVPSSVSPEMAQSAIDVAAQEAAESPENDYPIPSEGQMKAGNYRKGKVRLAGLNISIENPAGSERRFEKGKSSTLKSHYGYITGVQDGADGDKLDVFIGPKAHDDSKMVYVVDQTAKDGAFDEHKVMMGFDSREEAEKAYLAEYPKGWKGLGAVTELSLDEFKQWASGDGNLSKPLQYSPPAIKEEKSTAKRAKKLATAEGRQFQDWRLNVPEIRDDIGSWVASQTAEGGAMATIPVTETRGGARTGTEQVVVGYERTKSVNPGWFQDLAKSEGVTRKYIIKAAEKLKNGGRLGVKQQRVLQAVADVMEDDGYLDVVEFGRDNPDQLAQEYERLQQEVREADEKGVDFNDDIPFSLKERPEFELGQNTETRQAIHDAKKRVEARLSGRDVKMSEGEGELFAGDRPEQQDAFDDTTPDATLEEGQGSLFSLKGPKEPRDDLWEEEIGEEYENLEFEPGTSDVSSGGVAAVSEDGRTPGGEPAGRASRTPAGKKPIALPASNAGVGRTRNPKVREAARKEWAEKGTDSKFFKRWFGDSVTVDESGRPIVYYHATDDVFTVFDMEKLGSSSGAAAAGLGVFTTSNRAQSYTYGGRPMPLYVRARNPYIMGLEEFSGFETRQEAIDRRNQLLSEGYDSIIIQDEVLANDQEYVIALQENGLKSADKDIQTGEFSESKDIRYSAGKKPPEKPMSHGEVVKIASDLVKEWKGMGAPLVAVSTEKELPGHILQERDALAPGMMIEGVYDPLTGAQYLVSENLASAADVQRVVFEEVLGHGGLRATFGEELEGILEKVYQSIPAEDVARLRKVYTNMDDSVIAEEYLAKMRDVESSPWQMFISWIRRWLRGNGFADLKMSDTEIRDLVEVAHERIKYGVNPFRAKLFTTANGQKIRQSFEGDSVVTETELKPDDPMRDDITSTRFEAQDFEAIVDNAVNASGEPVMVVKKLKGNYQMLEHLARQRGAKYIIHKGGTERVDVADEAGKLKRMKGSPVFSIKPGDELVARHNLSAGNLIFADEMGGIPVPSFAVTTLNTEFEGYGEITLLADKDLVDPEYGADIYDADIYSTRVPRPQWKYSERKLRDVISELRKPAWKHRWDGFSGESWNRSDELDGPERMAVRLADQEWVLMSFIKEVGGTETRVPKMPDPKIAGQMDFLESPEFQAFLKENPDAEEVNDRGPAHERYQAIREGIAVAQTKNVISLLEENIENSEEGSEKRENAEDLKALYEAQLNDPEKMSAPSYFELDKMFRALEYVGKEVPQVVNLPVLSRRLEAKVKRLGGKKAVKKWLIEKLRPAYQEQFIKNQAGRKFPFTLQGLVDSVGKNVKGKEGNWARSLGEQRGRAAKRFQTIEEIRKAASNRVVPEEQFEKAKENLDAQFEQLTKGLAPYYEYSSTREMLDDASQAIGDWLVRGGGVSGMASALYSRGFNTSMGEKRLVPDYLAEEAVEVAKTLRQMPTTYFEGRQARAVNLFEFAGAVIPKTAPKQVKEILKKNNVTYRLYDPKVPGSRQKAVERFPKRTALGQARFALKAWHGTPHEWVGDKADISRIGTGEGAQAYGYGLYFTERREVAEWYRDNTTDYRVSVDGKQINPVESISEQMPNLSGEDLKVAEGIVRSVFSDPKKGGIQGYVETAKDLIEMYSKALDDPSINDAVKSLAEKEVAHNQKALALIDKLDIKDSRGRTYEVDLTPEQDEYLLWDKPLSEQSKKVRKALNNVIGGKTFQESMQPFENTSGAGLYAALSSDLTPEMPPDPPGVPKGWGFVQRGDEGQKGASLALREAGIRGIKYLDGDSRSEGEGSYNYVIFDDKDVKITARFSLSGEEESELYGKEFGDVGIAGGTPYLEAYGDRVDQVGINLGVLGELGVEVDDDLYTNEFRELVSGFAGGIYAWGEENPGKPITDQDVRYIAESVTKQPAEYLALVQIGLAAKKEVSDSYDEEIRAQKIEDEKERRAKIDVEYLGAYQSIAEEKYNKSKIAGPEFIVVDKIKFSLAEPSPLFRSQLIDVAEAKLPGSSSPRGYIEALEAFARKGQIKQEELDWSGAIDWLNEQKGKVSKNDVIEFLKENQVELFEAVLGPGFISEEDRENAFFSVDDSQLYVADLEAVEPDDDFLESNARDLYWEDAIESLRDQGELDPSEEEILDVAIEMATEAYFDDPEISSSGKVTIEGVVEFGDDYQIPMEFDVDVFFDGHEGQFEITSEDGFSGGLEEVFEHLASQELDNRNAQNGYDVETLMEDGVEGRAQYEQYVVPGERNKYRELLMLMPTSSGRRFDGDHWDEYPNVLVHVRFDERRTEYGEKVLFIDEVQSDWHQDGRKMGYRPIGDKPSPEETMQFYEIPKGDWDQLDEEEKQAYIEDADEQMNQSKFGLVDAAPFKKTWPLLAMKRMIRWAADRGYEKLAWSTGSQNAEIYNLRKHLSAIESIEVSKGKYRISIYDVDGRATTHALPKGDGPYDQNEIETIFGKEIAKRIVDREGQDEGDRVAALTDANLAVGGEGMVGFYDKMLPAMVNKYVKKWGTKANIMMLDSTGPVHAIQITPEMMAAAKIGQPMFSLAPTIDKAVKPSRIYDESLQERIGHMIHGLKEGVESDWNWKVRQRLFHAGASIEKYERRFVKEAKSQDVPLREFDGLLDAADSATKMYDLTKNLPAVMQVMYRHGVPIYQDGVFSIDPERKGLIDIFTPLFDDTKGQTMREWEAWAVAFRSNRLIGEGREHHLTRQEINDLLELDNKHGGLFRQVMEEWQVFNNQLLDLAVDRGTLAKETAEVWRTNDYIPFYRVAEDLENENDSGGFMMAKRGIDGQSLRSRRLTGADARVESPFENMILNTAKIINQVYRNETMRRVVGLTEGIALQRIPKDLRPTKIGNEEIIDRLVRSGVARQWIPQSVSLPNPVTDKPGHIRAQKKWLMENMDPRQIESYQAFFKAYAPQGDNIVSYSENGELVYFRVTDPDLLRTIQEMTPTRFGALMDLILVKPKSFLTEMVTNDPGFMLANYLRDLFSSLVLVSGNPFKRVASSAGVWADALFNKGRGVHELADKLMAAGGMPMGFYSPIRQNESPARMIEGELKGKNRTIITSPKKLYQLWRKVGMTSEQANRIAIAKEVLARGGSMAEASWQAQDLLNFGSKGDSSAIQFLARTVPFLNARMQGLYKMYRSAVKGELKDGLKMGFFARGAALVGATLALLLKNTDDERYDHLPEHAKDTYYHFFLGDEHFMLPKPFEVGVLFSTVWERAGRLMMGDDTTKQFSQSAFRALWETFSFNPFPQIARPIIEQWANKDFFRGRPIVNFSLSGLEPKAQYHAWTSETARAMGALMDYMIPDSMKGLVPESLRSPVRIEHNVRAYTGTMGAYLLHIADNMARDALDMPDAPAPRQSVGIPGVRAALDPVLEGTIRRFYRGDPDLARGNRYKDELYEMLDRADSLYRSMNAYKRQGRMEAAVELYQENRPYLQMRKRLHAINTQLRQINNAERLLRFNRVMSGEAKREALDQLVRRRNGLLKEVAPIIHFVQ